MSELKLISIDEQSPRIIRDWQTVYNELFILAPARAAPKTMSFKEKEACLKAVTWKIAEDDKTNGTANFEELCVKHGTLISQIAAIAAE